MSAADLPERPDLEHLKNQAKALLRAYRESDPQAAGRFRSLPLPPGVAPKLADAQRLVAREYGFPSWAKLKAHVLAKVEPKADLHALVKAAFDTDDATELRRLIARHPELKAMVNAPVLPFDSPPINWVRSRAMLDVLLEAGADINARSRWWAGGFGILDSVPPHLAAYAIERGATVTIHAAARLGMFDKLRAIIAADPSRANARGGDGQTPLHVASTLEIAEYLLDHGAEIDALDIDHEATPAQYLVRDHQDIVRMLIRRGCRTDILMAAAVGDVGLVRRHLDEDPDSVRTSVSEEWFPKRDPRAGGHIYIWKLGHNKTPHLVAREFGHDEAFRLLMDRSPTEVKLAQACLLGDEGTFRMLLDRHPDLIKSLADGERRKLVDAAQNNNLDAVKLMLRAGWPTGARGQHHATALHWAAFHGNSAMIRELLQYNPPLEDADNDFKSTPLYWAIYGSEHGWHRKTGDFVRSVQALCDAGAALPEKVGGTEAVRAVLRRYQPKDG
jgi:ankyrin repeat protein